MNSGPVSDRRERGGAVEAHQLPEYVDHPARPYAPRHIDRQTLTSELVDDGQALQRPAIRARIEDEVVGPHVIHRGRGQRSRAAGGYPPARAPSRHVQARLVPQTIGPLGTHRVPPARARKTRIFR